MSEHGSEGLKRAVQEFLDLVASAMIGQATDAEVQTAFNRLSAGDKQEARNEFHRATGSHLKF